MTLKIDSCVYHCTEGDILLIRPGHTHSLHIELPIEVSQPHVHFDPIYDPRRETVPISFSPIEAMTSAEQAQILADDLIPEFVPTVFRPQNGWEISLTLHRLAASHTAKEPYFHLEDRAILTELLIQIFREFTPKNTDAQRDNGVHLMSAVKSYIDNNYMNTITLESLSHQFHLDKFYLTKLFKSTYGISAIAYHHSVRFYHAKRMLQEGYNVTETSSLLGFDSIYSFSRAFFNAFGERPSEWKEHHERNETVI